jgi:hypothetical protein
MGLVALFAACATIVGADFDDPVLVDAGSAIGDGGSAGMADAAPTTPASCADIRAADAGSLDGVYLIDPDGEGPIASFHVHCADLLRSAPGSRPLEYINLAAGRQNDVSFGGGGYCPCATWVQTFTKVRLGNCSGPKRSYFATPGGCAPVGNNIHGVAHVDLSGTEFHISTDQAFVGDGFKPHGSVTTSPDRKSATINGSGECGWFAPEPTDKRRLRLARD